MSLRGPGQIYTRGPKGRVVRVGRTDGRVDQNCPLIFLILCTYIDKVYTYLKRKKKITQHPYGFENLMSSWGVGIFSSKLPYVRVFLKNHAKSMDFSW